MLSWNHIFYIIEDMIRKQTREDRVSLITRTEEMLLLTVCKYDGDAYGMTIREEMQKLTGRRYSIGGIYVPLDRLVKKGLLSTYESGPTPERGGRSKRLYRVTEKGFAALRAIKEVEQAMWAGLPDTVSLRLGLS